MRKIVISALALGVIAVPTTAVAAGHHGRAAHHHRHHHRGGLAIRACNAERRQLGRDAFRAKYGTDHPFRACVKAKRAAIAPAIKACRAERRQLGRDAFRAKYGTDHPFRACVKSKAPAGTFPSP